MVQNRKQALPLPPQSILHLEKLQSMQVFNGVAQHCNRGEKGGKRERREYRAGLIDITV